MRGLLKLLFDWVVGRLCLWLRPWCFRVSTRRRDDTEI